MPLSREEVKHIATLCRIALTEAEQERFRGQLSHILEQFDVLKQVDTSNLPPTSHSVPLQSVMREDESKDSFSKEDTLANAPRREDDFLRVNIVLEE